MQIGEFPSKIIESTNRLARLLHSGICEEIFGKKIKTVIEWQKIKKFFLRRKE